MLFLQTLSPETPVFLNETQGMMATKKTHILTTQREFLNKRKPGTESIVYIFITFTYLKKKKRQAVDAAYYEPFEW